MRKEISLSIVSHGQSEMLCQLLDDLERLKLQAYFKEIIIIDNISDSYDYTLRENLPIRYHCNLKPKGFGENHNFAFSLATGKYFCVVNPDIHLENNPFLELLNALETTRAAIVAPYVYSPAKKLEDNLRYFPTVINLLRRFVNLSDGIYPAVTVRAPYHVEWAAGMFLFFRSSDFRDVKGFDEKFFLYYEDVDICLRMWQVGKPVIADPRASVIHKAQRTSHKNLRYLYWHLKSLFRYLFKHGFRQPKIVDYKLNE